ncbi:MAG: complement resistance protein TraT, partial [Sphingomonas sp.]|nr:complement resistance protein TraT [Sphingomonas sp.]
DNNGNPARLHYTLRFDPDPNSWDPEIRNGGGGRTLIGAEGISMATIGGAVAGALIAIWMAPQASVTMTVVAAIAGGALGYIAGALVAKSLSGPSAHLPG